MTNLQYSYSNIKYKYLKDFIFNTQLKYVLLSKSMPTICLQCWRWFNDEHFDLILKRVEDDTKAYEHVIHQVEIKYKNTVLYPQLYETKERSFKIGEFKSRTEAEKYLYFLLYSTSKHIATDLFLDLESIHYYEILDIIE